MNTKNLLELLEMRFGLASDVAEKLQVVVEASGCNKCTGSMYGDDECERCKGGMYG